LFSLGSLVSRSGRITRNPEGDLALADLNEAAGAADAFGVVMHRR
jgi:hypothetical protein